MWYNENIGQFYMENKNMDFCSSITLITTQKKDTVVLERLLDDDSFLSDFVDSYDINTQASSTSSLVINVETSNDNTMDIYGIRDLLTEHIPDIDVVYALTNSTNFIDVISTSGDYDTHIDSDIHLVEELCSTNGLPFYGSDADEEYEEEETDSDDWESNYWEE